MSRPVIDPLTHVLFLVIIAFLAFIVYGIIRRQFVARYYRMVSDLIPGLPNVLPLRVFSIVYAGSAILALLAFVALYVALLAGIVA